MHIIVDAHADLAWNMLKYGRDYTRAAHETRQLEIGSQAAAENGDTLLGWPDYQRARVAVVFSTLYATPFRWKTTDNELHTYKTFDEAHRLYRDQLDAYHRLTDSHPDKFRLLRSQSDLSLLLDDWHDLPESSHPVGLVVLMEGAEAIRELSELEEWHEKGLRLIGPAWVGTRYSGGWREPGPLTDDGRKLLSAMSDFNFILDLSHMDEPAALEALDRYEGPIVATHGNCLSLVPGFASNRLFSDRLIEGVIERDGVIGVVPFNPYLKAGWTTAKSRREELSLADLANHIDHICQMAGDSLHAGIGSDFDGGFGVQSVPHEIDTVADLQNLVSLLMARGYSDTDTENILGGNWITRLKRELPAS
ncbi:MAG: membrane dipeptidase [Chloroflexi bacterium]|nr:membrane dipeptidase [Chloroflexota bacterium]